MTTNNSVTLFQAPFSAISLQTPCASFIPSLTWRSNFLCPPLPHPHPYPPCPIFVSSWLTTAALFPIQGDEFNVADTPCKLRSNYVLSQDSTRKLSFSVGGLQIGQPKNFLFSRVGSGSFSVRAVAIVDGNSAVAVSVTDPPPSFPLLTEQRALATYYEAVRFLFKIEPILCHCARRFLLSIQRVLALYPPW